MARAAISQYLGMINTVHRHPHERGMAVLAIIGAADVVGGFGVASDTSANHVCMVYGFDRFPAKGVMARIAGIAAGYMGGVFSVAGRTCANDLAMVHTTDIQPVCARCMAGAAFVRGIDMICGLGVAAGTRADYLAVVDC